MMKNLPQERMQIAVGSLARARAALRWTVDHVRERTAFGKPIGALQNTRFVLADVTTEVSVAEAFIDRCVIELNAGRLSPADAAKAKLWATEMEFRCLDCLPTTVRRLRLHARISDCPLGDRRSGDAGIRRYVGDHARNHRPRPRC